jgi:hypothetical protein
MRWAGAGALLLTFAAFASAHEANEPYADWFTSLKQPSGISCCGGSDHDCRNVEATPIDDGWQVWADWKNLAHPSGDRRLISIPRTAAQFRENPTGQPVLCSGPFDQFFCFVPANET